MTRRSLRWGMAWVAAACWGCGDQGVESDPAESVVPHTLTVSYGTDEQDVTLDQCSWLNCNEVACATIAEVVTTAYPDVEVADVVADFEAGDGFRPASKDFCTTLIPVPGTLLVQGYVEVETGNLQWDEQLDYPGCMHVTDVSRIEIAEP